MEKLTEIGGRKVIIKGDINSDIVIFQPVTHLEDWEKERTFKETVKLTEKKAFSLIGFQIFEWNKDLAPWDMEPVRGDSSFYGGADKTIDYILNELIPFIEKEYPNENRKFGIAGYSLGGLFAIYCAYQSDLFYGVAGVSPSVWFKDWISYATDHKILSKCMYLSVGKKEEKTNHPVMKNVRICLEKQYELSIRDDVKSFMELNNGNHFLDPDLRTAKGISFIINSFYEEMK